MIARIDEGIMAAHTGEWRMIVHVDEGRFACLDTQAGHTYGHYFDKRVMEIGSHRHILALQYDQTSHTVKQTGG